MNHVFCQTTTGSSNVQKVVPSKSQAWPARQSRYTVKVPLAASWASFL
jgi:hypothetical protein